MSDLPQSILESSITIGDIKLRCHVLDDGRRVFNAEDVHELINSWSEDGPVGEPEMEMLARWITGLGP